MGRRDGVLDIGGGRGDFLIARGVHGVVLEMNEESALFGSTRFQGEFVRYDGGAFPFKDRAAPVVVSMDALEHVPKGQREGFLHEIRRVSDERVVMTFPSDRQHFTRALLFVSRVHRRINLGSVAEKSLLDHAAHGLPKGAEVIADFEKDGWSVDATWTFGIVLSFVMLLQYAVPICALTPLTKLLARMLRKRDIGEPSYVFLTARRLHS